MNFKNISKHRYFCVLLIMGFGLGLRMYKIGSPIFDLYPTRQEQCAMIARNFFRHGFKILRPEVDWFGGLSSFWRIEFPLTSYITAFLYSLFGIHEFLGRLVSVAFSLGCIYVIYIFTEMLFSRRIAIYASLLFAVSPLAIYFGRAFMSDSAMLFFSILSLCCFFRWIEKGSKVDYLLAVAASSIAFLLKLPSLYLCVPLFYIGYSKLRSKIFLKPPMYIFFLISLLPSLVWYSNTSNNMINFYITNKSNLATLLKPDFYRRILESLSIFVLTPLGSFLALLGFILPINKRAGYFLHFWLLGIIIYTLVAPELNYIHYHYQLPLVPVFVISAARVLDRLHNQDEYKRTIFSKINLKLTISMLLIAILITSFISTTPFYKTNHVTLKASQAVNALTERNAIVIAGRCMQQAPLYYTDRKGWETNEDPGGLLAYSWSANLDKYNFPKEKGQALEMPDEVGLIKFLIQRGAGYYFTTNMGIFNKEPDLREFLYSNFEVLHKADGFVIFKLSKR